MIIVWLYSPARYQTLSWFLCQERDHTAASYCSHTRPHQILNSPFTIRVLKEVQLYPSSMIGLEDPIRSIPQL